MLRDRPKRKECKEISFGIKERYAHCNFNSNFNNKCSENHSTVELTNTVPQEEHSEFS